MIFKNSHHLLRTEYLLFRSSVFYAFLTLLESKIVMEGSHNLGFSRSFKELSPLMQF